MPVVAVELDDDTPFAGNRIRIGYLSRKPFHHMFFGVYRPASINIQLGNNLSLLFRGMKTGAFWAPVPVNAATGDGGFPGVPAAGAPPPDFLIAGRFGPSTPERVVSRKLG